jgi:hypothetical protein
MRFPVVEDSGKQACEDDLVASLHIIEVFLTMIDCSTNSACSRIDQIAIASGLEATLL